MLTKVRKLKVTEQTRVNGKTYGRSIVKSTPKINIGGNWLKDAGFYIGDFVEVMIADNFIQILKLNKPLYKTGEEVKNDV